MNALNYHINVLPIFINIYFTHTSSLLLWMLKSCQSVLKIDLKIDGAPNRG